MPLRSFIFASAMESEGKTEILVNLGIVLAQNKWSELFLDADFRRPTLNRWLRLDNMVGLSQIFVHPELGVGYSLQPTRINGLNVLTSEDSPPNTSELLGSQLIGLILEELKKIQYITYRYSSSLGSYWCCCDAAVRGRHFICDQAWFYGNGSSAPDGNPFHVI